MNIEPHLRRALAPVSPPRGFADRVVARASQDASAGRAAGSATGSRRAGWPVSRAWLAVAASLVLTATGSLGYLQHERRLEGERARAQVIEALQVTRAVLDAVQRTVADRRSEPAPRN